MFLKQCIFTAHQAINIANLLLVIGIVVVIAVRYQRLKDVSSSSSSSGSTKKIIPDIPINMFAQMSYDTLVQYHRQKYLKKYRKVTYLDYATHPVLAGSMLEEFSKSIHSNLFGNTHSESQSAELSTKVIEDARTRILAYFETNLSEYIALFTYSNYHSLKLLTETLIMNEKNSFVYTTYSNDDILKLRSVVEEKKKNVKIQMVELDQIVNSNHIGGNFKELITDDDLLLHNKSLRNANLVVLPLVDEFDGTVLTTDQIKKIGNPSFLNGQTITLIDASLYLQNHKLSLSDTPFHAVSFSFEKMFGFPNLGCLLLHNSLIPYMKKPYFGGGTLVYALTNKSFEKLRLSPQERFEDGSLPFLSIVSIDEGFTLFESLQFERMSSHISKLKEYVLEQLSQLRHLNGSPLCQIYGKNQFSIITFNVLDTEANIVSGENVVKNAAKADIYIVETKKASPDGNEKKLDHSKAVKISFGWATTIEDIELFINWLKKEYVK